MQSTDPHGMGYDIAPGELADEALDRDGGIETRFTAGHSASTFFNLDGD